MEVKSIFYKVLFYLSIILAILCCINNSAIENLTRITVVPLFIINILIVINSINTLIIDITSEKRQYYKEFENDETISKEEQKGKIKQEIVYDKICHLFEININRFISSIMVIVLVILFLLMIFHNQIYNGISNFDNIIAVLSCTLLIIDVNYKEKIAKRIIGIFYKYENKRYKDEEI